MQVKLKLERIFAAVFLGKIGGCMRKILKISVLCCLLCCFMASTAYAGDSSFSKYDVSNTGHTFKSTGSSNTKATAGANWFFTVSELRFTASTAGTLGMAYVPMTKGVLGYSVAAEKEWALRSFSGYRYGLWGKYPGSKNKTYYLGVRVDSEYKKGYAHTSGLWNSN